MSNFDYTLEGLSEESKLELESSMLLDERGSLSTIGTLILQTRIGGEIKYRLLIKYVITLISELKFY